MQENPHIPKFVSVVAIGLGCIDLVRGFVQTIVLEYAALNIAGLDLSTSAATDLLRLMGAFGISNYITGAMLILLGWKARHLALTMLAVLPVAYGIGSIGIRANVASYVSSQANWGGVPMMMAYMAICVATFVSGTWIRHSRKRIEA